MTPTMNPDDVRAAIKQRGTKFATELATMARADR